MGRDSYSIIKRPSEFKGRDSENAQWIVQGPGRDNIIAISQDAFQTTPYNVGLDSRSEHMVELDDVPKGAFQAVEEDTKAGKGANLYAKPLLPTGTQYAKANAPAPPAPPTPDPYTLLPGKMAAKVKRPTLLKGNLPS